MKIRSITQLAGVAAVCALLAACGADTAEPATSETAALEADASDGLATAPLLDPNTASEEALAAIASLTAGQVDAIIAGRPYETPSQLHDVFDDSLDDATQRAIYSALFVKVGLNNGDSADYALIPSSLAPHKLAHEIEEYRPYRSVDDFEREMSKYVSDEEVAFLTRYVYLD